MIVASVLDLVEAMHVATPVPLEKTLKSGSLLRGTHPVSGKAHGEAAGQEHGRALASGIAPVPPEVPDLPRGYLVRSTILDGIKSFLSPSAAAPKSEEEHAAASTSARSRSAVERRPPISPRDELSSRIQGMGGSGKTTSPLRSSSTSPYRRDRRVFQPAGFGKPSRRTCRRRHQLTKKHAGNVEDEILPPRTPRAAGACCACSTTCGLRRHQP